MPRKTKKEKLITEVYRNPEYEGRHVIIINDKIYSRKTAKARSNLLEKLLKKFPQKTPTIIYVPAEESLILIC